MNAKFEYHCLAMDDSRKYLYHTTDGFSEFRGQGGGGFLELEIQRHGGILTSGILKAWGVLKALFYGRFKSVCK